MNKRYLGKVDMGSYDFTAREYEARNWCHRNNIWMTPVAKNTKQWYIEVRVNGDVRMSPGTYGKDEIWRKCFEFYTYYYNKLNK
jgi:hypothetical protein